MPPLGYRHPSWLGSPTPQTPRTSVRRSSPTSKQEPVYCESRPVSCETKHNLKIKNFKNQKIVRILLGCRRTFRGDSGKVPFMAYRELEKRSPVWGWANIVFIRLHPTSALHPCTYSKWRPKRATPIVGLSLTLGPKTPYLVFIRGDSPADSFGNVARHDFIKLIGFNHIC